MVHARGFWIIGRRVLLGWLALAAAAMPGCLEGPLDPVLPSWDVELTLPLTRRSYSLLEVVEKDTGMLRVGSGGEIIYRAHAPIPPTPIGDLLRLLPPDTSARIRFGAFSVSMPQVIIPLSVPGFPSGVTVPLPDTTVHMPEGTDTLDSFERILVRSGFLRLTLANALPVPVEILAPVDLSDGDGNHVARFVFGSAPIPPGGRASAEQELRDQMVGNELRLTGLVLHTPGSTVPVPVPAGPALLLTLEGSALKVVQAEWAEIPAQRLVDNDTAAIPLDDSTLVRELRVGSGRMTFRVVNGLDLDLVFRFRLEEALRPLGGVLRVLEDSVFLPAGGQSSLELDLGGCIIRSPHPDLLRSLTLVSSVIVPHPSGGPVTVSHEDRVTVHAAPAGPLVADSVVGVLRPTWIPVHSSVRLGFGDLPTRFSGQLHIPAASLALETSIRFGFPMDLHLRVGGRRPADGVWVFLQVPASQKRVLPGSSTIQFAEAEVGQFLSALGGSLPESLQILGSVHVNPPEVYSPTLSGLGTAGSRSTLSGEVDLEVPLRLGIVSGSYADTLTVGDTTGDGAADISFGSAAWDRMGGGSISLLVVNALPLRLDVGMTLLDGEGGILLRVPAGSLPLSVPSAVVDGGGNVISPSVGRPTVRLEAEQVRILREARRLVLGCALSTPPGVSAVRFRSTDSVSVRAWCALMHRVVP
ncbi:MAG: hypothetical protein WB626_08885 [Bacteroidota bacterium]